VADQGRAVQQYFARWIHRIRLHLLPNYAPQTNPIKRLWWHLLEHDRVYVRKSAALALGQIGGAARSARPALERLQGDRLTYLQAAAEAALREIGD